jgi:zinc protease
MRKIKFTAIILLTAMICMSSQATELIGLKKNNSNKIVIKYQFNVGSMMDPVGKEGLSMLTASLISDGGSFQYTKSEIDDLMYPMASSYYASIDKEITVFTFEVHQDFIDTFYDIAKGLLYSPAFDENDFDRIKSNQQNYVDQIIKASSDEEYSKMALEDLLFRGTSYQHMIMGTSTGVKAITLEDVKAHYKKYFTKDNLLIGIAGNYPDTFTNQLLDDASQLPSLEVSLPEPPAISMPDGIQVEIVEKQNALGSAVYAGYPLQITRADDEFAALMVANSWLGEHRKSYGQLYNKIREKRSMNYGDYTYIEWYENGGRVQLPLAHAPRHSNYFSLWIRPVQIGDQLKAQYDELSGIEVGHAPFALRLAIREIDMLAKNGLTQEDFELTRQFLRSYIKLYVQTMEKELGFLMDSKFYGRADYISELDELLANLTLDEVNKAAKKYFQVDNMYICIVTDDSETGPLSENLRNNKLSPMSYSDLVREGLPEEILTEDEEVSKYKLNVRSVKIVDSEQTFK